MISGENSLCLSTKKGLKLYPIQNMLEFSFNPERADLSTDIAAFCGLLEQAKNDETVHINLKTSSPLILILIPCLLPLRDRIQVEFQLECSIENGVPQYVGNASDDFAEEFAKTRRFKELLEAAEVLSSHDINLNFTRKGST